MLDMTQPFNENGFNFTKIRPDETIAEMVYECEILTGSEPEVNHERLSQNLLVINVSPLEYCHYLFVPDVFSKWSQVS